MESEYGIPTVPIHTDIFANIARLVAKSKGMPGLRSVFVPQPVMGQSEDILRRYLTGLDPITGNMVMQEVIDALTVPLGEEDIRKVVYQPAMPRCCEADTEENFQRLFLENHWTDQMPIILPTPEKVAEMLAATSRKADEGVGKMRPTYTREYWAYTVEKVAVNAVMAGAKPEYFPVILALASTCITARNSTTSSGASMAVVNGPIRQEIGMNWGIGAMGPYNHANATIGRAYGLLSQNLQGGSIPMETFMGSSGNNYAYNSVTFAENEECSPWEPFHVQHGFKREESVVSVFDDCVTTSFALGLREKHWREHLGYMLRGMDPESPPVFLLDPIAARLFVERGGFDTPARLAQWVHENAKLPAGIYWDIQGIQNHAYPDALKGVEPFATFLKAGEDDLIPIFQSKDVKVIVVGGETNGYWRAMGARYRKSVSIDAWR